MQKEQKAKRAKAQRPVQREPKQVLAELLEKLSGKLEVKATSASQREAGGRGELSPNLDRLTVGVDLGDQWSHYCIWHLSRKLCLRDSCRDLEAGLKHGIELVKYTSDIASQALPLTLLERRDGEAELELERVLGVEVPTTVTSHDFQLAINGLDDIGGGQRTTNGFWTVEKGQVVQAFLA